MILGFRFVAIGHTSFNFNEGREEFVLNTVLSDCRLCQIQRLVDLWTGVMNTTVTPTIRSKGDKSNFDALLHFVTTLAARSVNSLPTKWSNSC